jgi:hypothetical protein
MAACLVLPNIPRPIFQSEEETMTFRTAALTSLIAAEGYAQKLIPMLEEHLHKAQELAKAERPA